MDVASIANINRRVLNNTRFADDIDIMGKTKTGLKEPTTRLKNRLYMYERMAWRQTRRRARSWCACSCQDRQVNIKMNEEQLEVVIVFNRLYSGALIPAEESSYEEIRAIIGLSIVTRLTLITVIWKTQNISTAT